MNGSLDVGAVIRRAFEIYVEEAPVLLPAAAVVPAAPDTDSLPDQPESPAAPGAADPANRL